MKECPDLTVLSRQEKLEYWQGIDPRKLKRLGDRLLAESLPHVEVTRSREEISQDVVVAAKQLGWSLEEVAETVGITPDLLEAFADDRVKAPECLPMVLERLHVLTSKE